MSFSIKPPLGLRCVLNSDAGQWSGFSAKKLILIVYSKIIKKIYISQYAFCALILYMQKKEEKKKENSFLGTVTMVSQSNLL